MSTYTGPLFETFGTPNEKPYTRLAQETSDIPENELAGGVKEIIITSYGDVPESLLVHVVAKTEDISRAVWERVQASLRPGTVERWYN